MPLILGLKDVQLTGLENCLKTWQCRVGLYGIMAVQSRTLRYHGSAESDSMYGIMAVQSRTLGYHGSAETDSTVSWQRKVGLYGIMAVQSRTLGYHGSAESDSTISWQCKVGLNGVMISVTHSLYRKPTFNSTVYRPFLTVT